MSELTDLEEQLGSCMNFIEDTYQACRGKRPIIRYSDEDGVTFLCTDLWITCEDDVRALVKILYVIIQDNDEAAAPLSDAFLTDVPVEWMLKSVDVAWFVGYINRIVEDIPMYTELSDEFQRRLDDDEE